RKDEAREVSPRSEIDAFLTRVRSAPKPVGGGHGRLIFAMDTTMSRQPTWDRALQIQSEMFRAARGIGGLDGKRVSSRVLGGCRASRCVSDAAQLAGLMCQVACRGGHTQLRKVLRHVRNEAGKHRVSAVVYVGDCMEQNGDELC